MRERIAQRLKDAQNTYAMLTTFQEADMFNLINMREDFKVRLSFLCFAPSTTHCPLLLFTCC
jgi:pyruvate/2-oxoglutarate dehydrogenase complex dihydrolipoamide acyltransferase (E2) component